jgi:cytoskeletal protein CcmA (bactofilin family)
MLLVDQLPQLIQPDHPDLAPALGFTQQDAAAAAPREVAMLGRNSSKPQATLVSQESTAGPKSNSGPLLSIVGSSARLEGKFEIADSVQIECEVGGELTVGGKLVIGEQGVVNATVQTVDAIVMGVYEGNMVATGNVEIAETGRVVTGNIETDSLVISKGGFFNGNVIKSKGDDAATGPRPVHLVEGARAATMPR